MQKPNFPNVVYRVSMQAGKPGEGPQVTVTAIPAKYNQATVSTASSRRIAFDKLGKIETIAESVSMHIIRVWVQSEGHIPEVVDKMYSHLQGATQRKLEAIEKMKLGLIHAPVITHKEWTDD